MNGLTNYLEQSAIQMNKNLLSNQPFLRIVEQPARASLRFRYECEGRSAGSIPGCYSTNERRSYPTIEIVNYVGRAIVTVSCVTVQPPYRPHPHRLVGKEGCSKGICSVLISNGQMRHQFESLGIQCVRKRDIVESLQLRQSLKIDPFKTGFAHTKEFSFIDLNAVRLCFQAFIENKTTQKFEIALEPVISDIIYDKKTMVDPYIYELSHSYASVSSQQRIILLCNCVVKDNIQVRFFEEHNDELVWEAYAKFLPKNVYKQTAISFKIPKYRLDYINQPVECNVQLRRKTDGQVSQPKKFYYLPDAVFQPVNLLIKSLSSSFGNYNLGTNSNLETSVSNSLVPNSLACNLVPNNLATNTLVPANLTQNLVANNLANCLTTTNLSNFPTNFVHNLSIQNLQQQQQQQHSASLQQPTTPQSNLQNQQQSQLSPTSSTPARKRCRADHEQEQAYNLAVTSKKICVNKSPIPASNCPNSIKIEKQPTENQLIINNFHSTLNPATTSLVDFDNVQLNAANHPCTTTNGNAIDYSNSVTSTLASTIQTPVSNSSYSSANLNTNSTNQVLEVEPTYIDFRNHLYQVHLIKDDSNPKVIDKFVIAARPNEANGDINLTSSNFSLDANSFVLNNNLNQKN